MRPVMIGRNEGEVLCSYRSAPEKGRVRHELTAKQQQGCRGLAAVKTRKKRGSGLKGEPEFITDQQPNGGNINPTFSHALRLRGLDEARLRGTDNRGSRSKGEPCIGIHFQGIAKSSSIQCDYPAQKKCARGACRVTSARENNGFKREKDSRRGAIPQKHQGQAKKTRYKNGKKSGKEKN